MNPLDTQVGGDHYKQCKMQPVEFIEANRMQFLEGCVIKRLARHDKPTGKGRQDIEKAIHELQLLLTLRYPVVATSVRIGIGDMVFIKNSPMGSPPHRVRDVLTTVDSTVGDLAVLDDGSTQHVANLMLAPKASK